MRGSRDICFGYYTRFSHRARDDVLPGAVDSTQAATSLPDSRVGRRMACQSDIHVAALGGLTCQGLPAPQHNRPPYCSVMRMEWATCVGAETSTRTRTQALNQSRSTSYIPHGGIGVASGWYSHPRGDR